MPHVFVYGTLLFPEILTGLTGRTFTEVAATLPGFRRMQVKFGDYPAIIKADETDVQGKLILDVDARSLELLRFYEGDDYDCIEAEVQLDDQKVRALVFVWKNDRKLIAEPDWNPDKFKNHFLKDYTRYVVPETVAEFTKLFS